MATAVPKIRAAPAPCTNLRMIRARDVGEKTRASEVRVKMARPMVNIFFRP
jgi:hypothetical protein